MTVPVDRIRLEQNGPLVYVRFCRGFFQYRLRLTEAWGVLTIRNEWPASTFAALRKIQQHAQER